MSRLQYEACKALVEAIGPFVPNDTKLSAIHEPPTQHSAYPQLVALPRKMTRTYWTETPLCDTSGDPVVDSLGRPVFLIGSGDGTIQLRAYAREAFTREEIEDGVNAAFVQTSGAPGTLNVDVINPTFHGGIIPTTITVKFDFSADEWREELVFSERRMEFFDVAVSMPLLAARPITEDGDNAIVTEIDLCLTQDVDTDVSGIPDPADKLAALEPFDTLVVT
jgi:hypothetical protein